jgi:putative FmdB family regulatory protein
MPIYEYRCERGHTFEVMQRMTDDPLTVCDEHGTPVQRVFHPVAVHFKGSGFYNTDYGKKKSGAAGASEGSSDSSSKSDSSGPDSSGSGSSGSGSSGSGSSGSGSSGSGSKDSSSTKSSSGSD